MTGAGSTRGDTARYDEIAELYVGEVGDKLDDPGTAAVLDLLDDVNGLRVLDLACGQGRVTRALARRGARVVGLDISRELLDKARAVEAEAPLGIMYVEGDAAVPAVLFDAPFHGVVCNYGVSDIDDLDGTLAALVGVLRPGGFFAFSLLHPCFPGWGTKSSAWPPGKGYFDEGWWQATGAASKIRRAVGANHRTLSTYLNALARHGLVLEEAREPGLPASWLEARPDADPVPAFFAARYRRGDAQAAV